VAAIRPKPPFVTQLIAAFAFLLLYVPLVTLVIYSFRTQTMGTSETAGWTLEWYRRIFANEAAMNALGMSLWVGFWCTLGATLLGSSAALALDRYQFRGRGWLDTLIYVPLVLPEIVLGLSLLIWFVMLRMTLGSFSIILAHITFSVSYVIITVKSRLQGFDRTLEEAARDLGATPAQTFWKVTFPLIWPGILSGALMAFTLSFDDFLITFFTAGVGSDTLPLKIYSMIKFGVTPEINALSTLLLGATLILVTVFFRSDSAAEH
jgi:spermidine/putrescine transport system permease protein